MSEEEVRHHHHHHESTESSSSHHHHLHSSGERSSREHNHHHHSEKGTKVQSFGTIVGICMALNILYVIAEGGIGLWQRSLGLLSDAGYNLGDIFGLLFAYYTYKLANKSEDSDVKHAYKRGTLWTAIASAVILLLTVGAVMVEALHGLRHPNILKGKVVLVTALIGVLVNGLTALLLVNYQKKNYQVRGAYWSMVADTLVSALVAVVGAVIIFFPTLTLIDPILGICIAIFILIVTINMLRKNLKLVHDGMPTGVTKDDVELVIGNHRNVASVHRVHVWALNANEFSMTAHIVLHDLSKLEETKKELKESLTKRLDIDHVTLEIDAPKEQQNVGTRVVESEEE